MKWLVVPTCTMKAIGIAVERVQCLNHITTLLEWLREAAGVVPFE